jgi:hypothetical protein
MQILFLSQKDKFSFYFLLFVSQGCERLHLKHLQLCDSLISIKELRVYWNPPPPLPKGEGNISRRDLGWGKCEGKKEKRQKIKGELTLKGELKLKGEILNAKGAKIKPKRVW